MPSDLSFVDLKCMWSMWEIPFIQEYQADIFSVGINGKSLDRQFQLLEKRFGLRWQMLGGFVVIREWIRIYSVIHSSGNNLWIL